ncbi:hypothetical protein PR202_gb15225 [Eleusine coracana subsp. coracana]|uniref:Kelch repeat-containing protein n=1 Tax=Eleusine coracana subsp. coracana TaxID=191504 RepID=A0AAV5EUZ7_ELECO|nr:hypothetical protein PR202_gb15225 [Eleusine coracana subsp. coracana]
MARPAAKARSAKHLVALAVVAVLGLVLVADFLWASSSSSASSPIWSSRLNLGSMDINATFADLPAPELKWEEMSEAPVVHSHVDVYNFSDNTWGGRGPTARNFVLDTETREWHDLPPLPVPRYAPATQLWRGRLHVMGGSKEDRHEPGLEHWSLAVKDGKALEKGWRSEIPIPRGGPHRACVVANDKLLVIGGQEGDFMAKPGSPIFKCVRRSEEWTVIGRLPFRIKTTLVGYWDGWLYFTSGQRDKGPKDPSPKKIVGSMWRTKLHL